MDDHGSQDIGDVLRNTPGVSVQAYDSERMEYSARGFAITNYQYDGINTIYDGVYDEGVTHVDMAAYDRIEVIKGATGLMTGSGDPSATVNLVRKKPTHDFKASITASAGSWDNYRTEGDISGSLNDSGSVRGRLVGAYQDRKSYLDQRSRHTPGFCQRRQPGPGHRRRDVPVLGALGRPPRAKHRRLECIRAVHPARPRA